MCQFVEAAEGQVLKLKGPALPPGKPRFKSQLSGTLGTRSLRACFWWAVTTTQSREELTGKWGFRPQQSTWWAMPAAWGSWELMGC